MDIPDTELAELRRKAHAFDSEQGRLQKTQTDLEAERAQRVELEKRLAASLAPGTPPVAQVDPRALEVFGADGVTLLSGMMTPVVQRLDTIARQFDERNQADARATAARQYQQALDTKLSEGNLRGFAARIYGGDLATAWAQFVETRPAVKRAQSEGDVETVSDMVSIFIHQNKELVAGGSLSPAAVQGFSPAVKSEFSDDDYRREMASLQSKLDNLTITEADFNKQSAAIYERWETAREKAERTATGLGLL